jgi:microcystin-dependent protein
VDPFVGEIRIVGFNFAPVGWATCDGQLLPISQNTALFSLLGTTYGGNGQSTFALPNLQGRAPIHAGQGTGLTPRSLGETGGQSTVALTAAQMPAHGHQALSVSTAATRTSPAGNVWASSGTRPYSNQVPNVVMAPGALGSTGGTAPHNNLQPYVTLLFIIAMQGVFPPRS